MRNRLRIARRAISGKSRSSRAAAPATIDLTIRRLVIFFVLFQSTGSVAQDMEGIPAALTFTAVTALAVGICTWFWLLDRNTIRSVPTAGVRSISLVLLLLALLSTAFFSSWSSNIPAIAALMLGFSRGVAYPIFFLATAACFGALSLQDPGGLGGNLSITILIAILVLLIWSTTQLNTNIMILKRSQETIARLTSDSERARSSQLLHDVIGHTLAAASARSQVARRKAVSVDPELLGDIDNIYEALDEGRQELRRLTMGRLALSIQAEIDGARELFGRLGIDHDEDITITDESRIDMLAALVIRESVTNILKHATPTFCSISVHQDSNGCMVTVTNNGANEKPIVSPISSGTGLKGLGDRLANKGGVLEYAQTGDLFVVRAAVPPIVNSGPATRG